MALPVHQKIEQASEEVRVFASNAGRTGRTPLSRPGTVGDARRIDVFVCSGNTFASTTAAFDSVEASD